MGPLKDPALLAFLRAERASLDNALAAAQLTATHVDRQGLGSWLATFLGGDFRTLLPHRPAQARRLLLHLIARLPALVERYPAGLLSGISRFFEWMLGFPDDLAPEHLDSAVHACRKLDEIGRLEPWLTRIEGALPACRSLEELLAAGRVAAWRSGATRFRDRSLKSLANLASETKEALLGFPLDDEALEATTRSRWAFDACLTEEEKSRTPRFKRGGFLGFGGPFVRPPLLAMDGGLPIAVDGSGSHAILFDSFGCELVRRSEGSECNAKAERSLTGPGFRIETSPKSHHLRIYRLDDAQA